MIETERLGLRKVTEADFESVAVFLKDPEVMYAWEHGFSDGEVMEWIAKNQMRYERDGFSYLAVVLKETGAIIGAMGPLVEEIGEERPIGLAYIFAKAYWGKGYALEGARACLNYAFETIGAEKVIAEIRPDNLGSRKLVEKLGMTIQGSFCKHYWGKDMEHDIYVARKE